MPPFVYWALVSSTAFISFEHYLKTNNSVKQHTSSTFSDYRKKVCNILAVLPINKNYDT